MNLNELELAVLVTFEEIHRLPSNDCVTGYYGDMSLHYIKNDAEPDKVNHRFNQALEELQLTREQLNAIADAEKFYLRVNIVNYFKNNARSIA